MTEQSNPLTEKVAKWRSMAVIEKSGGNYTFGYGLEARADELQAIIDSMCDVATQACVNPIVPEIGVMNEPCEIHMTRDTRNKVRWGKFSTEANADDLCADCHVTRGGHDEFGVGEFVEPPNE